MDLTFNTAYTPETIVFSCQDNLDYTQNAQTTDLAFVNNKTYTLSDLRFPDYYLTGAFNEWVNDDANVKFELTDGTLDDYRLYYNKLYSEAYEYEVPESLSTSNFAIADKNYDVKYVNSDSDLTAGHEYAVTDVANDGDDDTTDDTSTMSNSNGTVKSIAYYPTTNTLALYNTNTVMLDEAVADEAEAEMTVEYFNLQGQRVANPTTGIYIRLRNGNRADKVFIRQ